MQAVTHLFMDALSAFSADFNSTLRAAGGQFAGIGGLSAAVEQSNATSRLAYTEATANSLTYVDIGSFNSLASSTVAYASMRNAANTTVRVSTDTVQSAMTDFRAAVLAGTLHASSAHVHVCSLGAPRSSGETTLLFNGNGTQSYPMSFMHYLATNTSRVTPDCYSIEQYLVFLSWTQYDHPACIRASSNDHQRC